MSADQNRPNERASDIFELRRNRFFQIYRLAKDRYRLLPALVHASVTKRAALAKSRLAVRDFYILHRTGFYALATPTAPRRIEARFAPSKGRFVPNFHPQPLSQKPRDTASTPRPSCGGLPAADARATRCSLAFASFIRRSFFCAK